MVYGRESTGKSAFINAISSAFNKKGKYKFAPVGTGGRTFKITPYTILENQFYIYDTYGTLDKENLKSILEKRFNRRLIRKNYPNIQRNIILFNNLRKQQKREPIRIGWDDEFNNSNESFNILFVVISALDLGNIDDWKKEEEALMLCDDGKITPFIVVTHIDLCIKKKTEIIKETHKLFGLPAYQILLIKNFTQRNDFKTNISVALSLKKIINVMCFSQYYFQEQGKTKGIC